MTDKPPCEEDMTELTDEEAKALLAECDNPDCLTCEYARALLDTRAERDRLRADAAAAVALMVERAADACVDLAAQVSNAALTGLPEQARLRESMEAAFTKASHVIRALAPADGLAAVEALRVEARENAMQALASMGQAQEAYEAQLEAEAELARVRAREAGPTFYIDCEFDGHNGPLLSIAIVREDGANVYVTAGAVAEDPWVIANVLPWMNCHDATDTWHVRPLEVGTVLRNFIGLCKHPVIIADSPVDIARFCQAISTGEDGGWASADFPGMTFEVRNVDCYPTALEGAVQHNAWWDAMALRAALAAENASLKAREKVDANLLLAAYKGLLVLHRMLSKSGLSVGAETATYITDQIAAAHPEMPGLDSLRAAPTDPGDGWTWHERLGWIGPDGKPANPRRRG